MAGRGDRFINDGAEGVTVTPKKNAASVPSRKLGTKRVRKLANGVSILEKEILRPGRYVDEDGVEFDLTAEEIRAFVEGTQKLIAMPFRVNGFPDHQTNSSTAKLGRWVKIWTDAQGGARGHFEPINAAAEAVALDNDCSAVLVEGLNLGQFKADFAMPRIDIVPQGAVLGLQPFTKTANLAAGFKAQRVRCCARKENAMKSRLALILAHALGMDATDDEEGVIAALSAHLTSSRKLATEGLELGDEDMAAALKEMLAAGVESAETEAAADPEADPEKTADAAEEAVDELADAMESEGAVEEELEMSTAAPTTKKLATGAAGPKETAVEKDLRAQLASVQRRELDAIIGSVRRLSAKTSPIEAGSIAAIKADYAEDAKVFGHDKALGRAKRSLSLYLQLAKAKAAPSGKKVERKLATPPAAKPKPEIITPENNPLLALRGGPHKPTSVNGAVAN